MNILTYKRTHIGDPDSRSGEFGVRDCMGRVRGFHYAAVIGVGGIGAEPQSHGIAGRITWVGVVPRKKSSTSRGPVVTFDKFVYYGAGGVPLHMVAPNLSRRMYEGKARYLLFDYGSEEKREAETIVRNVIAGRWRKYGRLTIVEEERSTQAGFRTRCHTPCPPKFENACGCSSAEHEHGPTSRCTRPREETRRVSLQR